MAYFTLVARDAGRWSIQFGDYDRETVAAERTDTYRRDYAAADLKIIRTKTVRQSEIDAAVAKLNGDSFAATKPVAAVRVTAKAWNAETRAPDLPVYYDARDRLEAIRWIEFNRAWMIDFAIDGEAR